MGEMTQTRRPLAVAMMVMVAVVALHLLAPSSASMWALVGISLLTPVIYALSRTEEARRARASAAKRDREEEQLSRAERQAEERGALTITSKIDFFIETADGDGEMRKIVDFVPRSTMTEVVETLYDIGEGLKPDELDARLTLQRLGGELDGDEEPPILDAANAIVQTGGPGSRARLVWPLPEGMDMLQTRNVRYRKNISTKFRRAFAYAGGSEEVYIQLHAVSRFALRVVFRAAYLQTVRNHSSGGIKCTHFTLEGEKPLQPSIRPLPRGSLEVLCVIQPSIPGTAVSISWDPVGD